jgi:hypothetical protein
MPQRIPGVGDPLLDFAGQSYGPLTFSIFEEKGRNLSLPHRVLLHLLNKGIVETFHVIFIQKIQTQLANITTSVGDFNNL